jgi:hypothetical protein
MDTNSRLRRNRIETREYLIDHFRVSFQSGEAWKCACREFTRFAACRHAREAAGRREAQEIIKLRVSAGASGLRNHARRVI